MSSSDRLLSVISLYVNFSLLIHLKNYLANFNQTWQEASLCERISHLIKWISRGDNYEIAKIHWRNLKNFSRTTGPISPKLSAKHPWVKGFHICSNKGPRPFQRGDNYQIAKIHWQNLKICCCRITGPISTKLGIKHLLVKRTQGFTNKDHLITKIGDDWFSPLRINVMI